MTYQLICGAEIHIEPKTKSKMFCGCKNDPFGAEKPNIYTCPVCLGLPGGLPVPNKRAIEDTILLGLALHCEIPERTHFDRKHYFYPDLPKGYQISQQGEPLCIGGYVDTSMGRVRLNHIHLEEDAAKMHHAVVDGQKVSLIDYNRSSVPLIEIVTEPDIKSPEHAKEFLKKVRDIVRALGVSDCDMEKGTMRLEANISLSKDGSLPPYKVEVKNINSFRFFAAAMEYEYKRQSEILNKGETPIQETRGYKEGKGTTSQRRKEGAADYRYMPDGDIPPIVVDRAWVEQIRERMPKLPDQIVADLMASGVPESAAKIIVTNEVLLSFITEIQKHDKSMVKVAANDLVNKKINVDSKPIDYLKAKATKAGDRVTDEAVLKPIIEKLLADNPKIVEEYKSGKTGVLGFFVGNVMKQTQGKADPGVANKLLKDLLH
jgi:aspartyl-tRNA(Asn)/glutamyl-tRNA(Gln) amidotransferase subunit B